MSASRRNFFRRSIHLCLLICVGLPATLLGDESTGNGSPTISQVRLGFDGHFKVGHWIPIWVDLVGGSQDVTGQLELVAPDGDGFQSVFIQDVDERLHAPAKEKVTALRYVKLGRRQGGLTVRLRVGERIACERTFAAGDLPASTSATGAVLLNYGGDIGATEAILQRRRNAAGQAELKSAVVKRAADLPDRWYGYESIDTFVVATSQLSLIAELTADQIEAIRLWVQQGGRLIFCVGQNGSELLAPGKPLAALLPGPFDLVHNLRRTSDLESYANARQNPLDKLDGADRLMFSSLKSARGIVDSQESNVPGGQGPTIVRYPFGFGQITFVALDLDVAPISRWAGRPRLAASLLFGKAERQDSADLTGQLRGAIDRFSGVTLVSFTIVAMLTVIYILLIGPGDFFLLKKLLPRMEWTWVTFPTMVVAFCVMAYGLVQVCKGHRVKINQVELIDVDAATSAVRGTMWADVYSPQSDEYDLSYRAAGGLDVNTEGSLLSWQGLPGDGLGGMNNRTTTELFRQSYSVSGRATPAGQHETNVNGVPIQVAATKNLGARWWGRLNEPVDSKLFVFRANDRLYGEFTNPFDVELTGCIISYGKFSYLLDLKLGPLQAVRVDTLREKSLNMHLARRSSDEAATPWDTTSSDVPRIMEMMMFHRVVGGQAYTGLTHRYQDFTDLSNHLNFDMAILTGWTNRRMGELSRDDKSLADDYDQQWTFFRILMPVEIRRPSPAGQSVD